jgi:hypothetical protein
MLHLFLEKGPWFRAKSHGWGAGLPFKWQGWLLLVAHVATLGGIALVLQDRPHLLMPLVILAALAPMPLYAARTEGGWRWRWGDARHESGSKRR